VLGPGGLYVAVRSTGLEHRGGTLRVVGGDPEDTIDPAIAYSATAWSILSMTNGGLVGFRRVGGVEGVQLVPALAVALPTPTDGGKTYTFEVRRRIPYSDGTFVQPDDFRRAIERVFQVGSDGAGYYGGILGAERCVPRKPCDLRSGIVVDRAGWTVTFRLAAPDPDFLQKLAMPFAAAVPRGTPGRDVGTHPVPATGPYRITLFDRRRKTIRLGRNPRFREWSADAQPRGFPDVISISWRLDPNAARVRAVETGAADLALIDAEFSKGQLDELAVRSPAKLHVNSALVTAYFFLNTRVPPFDDRRVRRAVNIAFDRDRLARTLGRAYAPTCQILPPNFASYRPRCPYAPDGAPRLELARKLVQRSGTGGTRVTVWVPRQKTGEGRYMVTVLRSLGFDARLRAQDDVAHFTRVSDPKTRVQTGFYGWVPDFPSTAGFFAQPFGCTSFANVSRLCDPSVEAMMARAAAAQVQDPAMATRLWQEVEDAILARAPIVPMYNQSHVDLVSDRVGNYQYNPQWGVLLDQLWTR
jgi:peptide/nickel transport system substrate-binding protein